MICERLQIRSVRFDSGSRLQFFLSARIVATTSRIDPALVQAYRETEYRVLGAYAMVLRPDVHADRLAVLHQTLAVDCSAFITACNPLSQPCEPSVNAARQAALAQRLALRGHVTIKGIGLHPAGRWDGEPSFLVPGLSLEDASNIGRQFDQNAILWSGADATPRLVLLR